VRNHEETPHGVSPASKSEKPPTKKEKRGPRAADGKGRKTNVDKHRVGAGKGPGRGNPSTKRKEKSPVPRFDANSERNRLTEYDKSGFGELGGRRRNVLELSREPEG